MYWDVSVLGSVAALMLLHSAATTVVALCHMASNFCRLLARRGKVHANKWGASPAPASAAPSATARAPLYDSVIEIIAQS